jgi:hypothetical protein
MAASRIRIFWRKYRRYVLISLAIYVLLMLTILFLAAGPQNQPFIYQIF